MSKKQNIVSRSSTKLEYCAMTLTYIEIAWLHCFFPTCVCLLPGHGPCIGTTRMLFEFLVIIQSFMRVQFHLLSSPHGTITIGYHLYLQNLI